MNTVNSILPFLAVIASLAVIPILLSARSSNVREGWSFLAGIIKFGLVLSMTPTVLQGQTISFVIWHVLPGLPLALKVDAMGLLFALVSSSLWIITTLYSIGYMRSLDEHSQTRYYTFFAIALSSTIGVAFSANLLTMYLFYEMLSLSTYPLVTHHQDEQARSSGRKYLLYIVGSSIGLVLPAMVISYLAGGTLTFSAEGFLAGKVNHGLATVLMLAYLFGFAKAAVMPFHSWLPAAMVAPTPVSALLHAVAVVKVGAFCIVRVITGVFGVSLMRQMDLGTLVAAVVSVTIIVSSMIALSQDGLKRRLAFSTIGQVSYIVLGAALLTHSGVKGALLHIAMHAFGKITLFFCAGAIFVTTGYTRISQLDGLGRKMPWTFSAFFIGALSVIGIPPGGGFISKWFLVIGCLERESLTFLAVLLVSSLLNAAYFLPIVYNAFFKPLPAGSDSSLKESPKWCLVPLLCTAGISVLLCLFPHLFVQLAEQAAAVLT